MAATRASSAARHAAAGSAAARTYDAARMKLRQARGKSFMEGWVKVGGMDEFGVGVDEFVASRERRERPEASSLHDVRSARRVQRVAPALPIAYYSGGRH